MRSSILEEQLSLKHRTNESSHLTTGKSKRECMIMQGSYEKSAEREPLFQKLSRSQMGADGMQLSHSDANINVSVLHADLESSELDKQLSGQEDSSDDDESEASKPSQQDTF